MPNNPTNLSENNKSDIRWNYLLRKYSENAKKPDKGVSYSQKIRGKRSIHNLTYSRNCQFMFPKYLIEHQIAKEDCEIKI